MKTKAVTYSNENYMPQPLGYKWWFNTNMFWIQNRMSAYKPHLFMERAERYISEGEVTREQVQRDFDTLNSKREEYKMPDEAQ